MKNSFLFLVTICMVFSSTVFAQEPESKSDNTPRLVPYNYQGERSVNLCQYQSPRLNDRESAVATNTDIYDGYYLAGQFIIAEVSGCLGLFAGALIGFNILDGSMAGGVLSTYAGFAMGVSLGSYGIGEAFGQNGSYKRALLGSLLGTAIAIGVLALETDSNPGNSTLSITAGFLLPPICSMAMYNKKAKPQDHKELNGTDYSPEISVGQLGYYQDACGGLGVKMDLLSYRF